MDLGNFEGDGGGLEEEEDGDGGDFVGIGDGGEGRSQGSWPSELGPTSGQVTGQVHQSGARA